MPDVPPAPPAGRDLPTGTVTLLFTDIEGSTQLLHHLGERYAQLLADQRDLLRAACARHGGREVDNQGDAFFFAFPQAGDAVAAAADAQRALFSHPWPDRLQLRVRMGLHTGEPLLASTGYIGLDVHRAARVAAAAHGGQVLLTEATRAAAEHTLPGGVSLRDLGEVRLKDLKRPEHIYQVVALDLPGDFAPLKGLDLLDAHLETVARGLAEARVVVFLGPGANLVGRPASRPAQAVPFELLPSSAELAEHLAQCFNYPVGEPRDLVRVSQYIAVKQGIGPLYDELRKVLKREFPPTPLHSFLAGLPRLLREKGDAAPQLIVTSNFDDALERAFQAEREPFDLVSYVAHGEAQGKFQHTTPDGKVRVIDKPNKYLGVAPDVQTVILKIHGYLDRAQRERDSYVITEDNYIDYLANKDIAQQVPAKLLEKMSWSHLLFLGYSLRDWPLRVILHRLWGDQKLKYKSWAVHPRAHPIEKEFWLKRDVDILDVPLEDYVEALRERIAVLAPAEGQA